MKVNKKVLIVAGGIVIWTIVPFSTDLMIGGAAVLRALRRLRLQRLQRAVAKMAREAKPNIARMGTFVHYNTGRSTWVS